MSNSRRISRPTTKKKKAISPSLIHSRSSSVMPVDPKRTATSVVQNFSYVEDHGEFAQTNATAVAATRTIAPAFCVAKNARNGDTARLRSVWRGDGSTGAGCASVLWRRLHIVSPVAGDSPREDVSLIAALPFHEDRRQRER